MKRCEYLIHEGRTTHVLRAYLLPRAYGPAATPLLLTHLPPVHISSCIPILHSSDACLFIAANVDATVCHCVYALASLFFHLVIRVVFLP